MALIQRNIKNAGIAIKGVLVVAEFSIMAMDTVTNKIVLIQSRLVIFLALSLRELNTLAHIFSLRGHHDVAFQLPST